MSWILQWIVCIGTYLRKCRYRHVFFSEPVLSKTVRCEIVFELDAASEGSCLCRQVTSRIDSVCMLWQNCVLPSSSPSLPAQHRDAHNLQWGEGCSLWLCRNVQYSVGLKPGQQFLWSMVTGSRRRAGIWIYLKAESSELLLSHWVCKTTKAMKNKAL